jgi:hypothetical protein
MARLCRIDVGVRRDDLRLSGAAGFVCVYRDQHDARTRERDIVVGQLGRSISGCQFIR